MTSCLIVVDVQNDFCEKGPLTVEGSLEIIEGINREIQGDKYKYVVFTGDSHPKDHISFACNHEGQEPFSTITDKSTGSKLDLWPAHCIQGTHGAELHSDLKLPADAKIFHKGTKSQFECYSGFGNDDETDTGLQAYLKSHQVQHCYIVGLAYDYCVRATALASIQHGYTTTIIEDLTRGVNQDNVDKFRIEFVKLGGLITKSK